MQEVKFQEETIAPFQKRAVGGMLGWVMRSFNIESESQAALILTGFIAFCVVISGFIVFSSGARDPDLPRDQSGQIILEGRRSGFY
jgi:hypothetical protein